jgi:hypothetical protein
MLRESRLVLLARAVKIEKTAPRADMADLPEAVWPVRVTLLAERVWKGPRTREYAVVSDVPWNTCGYAFVEGERYVIYSKDGQIPAGACDAIYPLQAAADHVRALDRATQRRARPRERRRVSRTYGRVPSGWSVLLGA